MQITEWNDITVPGASVMSIFFLWDGPIIGSEISHSQAGATSFTSFGVAVRRQLSLEACDSWAKRLLSGLPSPHTDMETWSSF